MPAVNFPLVNAAPPTKVGPHATGGVVRVISETFTYATDAAGSYSITGGLLPVGARVLDAYFVTSVTTGSATLALGISGTTAKYINAAAVTTANSRTVQVNQAALLTEITTAEQLLLTVAAASLPASGTLRIVVTYVVE
jgi:hypothetical protein